MITVFLPHFFTYFLVLLLKIIVGNRTAVIIHPVIDNMDMGMVPVLVPDN